MSERPPSPNGPRATSRASQKRPVLYQLARAGTVFQVGDGPILLDSHSLVIGRMEAESPGRSAERLPVDDPWMSTRHARVAPLERRATDSSVRLRGPAGEVLPGRFVVEDLGSTNGVTVNGAPATRVPLLHGDFIETGRTFWVYVEEPVADAPLEAPFEFGALATWTPSFAAQLRELAAQAREEVPVLITGPAGSGKGFVARTLHHQSGRSGRLVHLDCKERKPKRLPIDLFGADGQSGRVHDAEGGTLFLENIDALPLDVQDRLLESMRKKGPSGARVVAAMPMNAVEAVAQGRLRQALADALGTVQLELPTLRQRLPDLGLLLDDFLARARAAPAVSRDAMRVLLRSAQRLPAKTLSRVVEAAASLASVTHQGEGAGSIELVHLPVDLVGPGLLHTLLDVLDGVPDGTSEMALVDKTGSEPSHEANTSADVVTDASGRERPSTTPHDRGAGAEAGVDEAVSAAVDPDAIIAALRATHGNVSAAARHMGRPRALVQRWLSEFRIDPARYR